MEEAKQALVRYNRKKFYNDGIPTAEAFRNGNQELVSALAESPSLPPLGRHDVVVVGATRISA